MIFLRNMPQKFPQYRYFTRQNAFLEKTLLVLLSQFLVDPLLVLVSQQNRQAGRGGTSPGRNGGAGR